MIKKILLKLKDGFVFLIKTFIKPIFFGSKNVINPIYFYVSICICLFFASVIEFLKLANLGATVGIKDPQIILPALAGVITTLIALVTLMLKAYNDGKTPPSDPPAGPTNG